MFGNRYTNVDGSHNVFCNRCREYICTVASAHPFHSALCVVCQAADRGEVFPEETLKQLRSRKFGENYVPLSIADAPFPQDPMFDPESLPDRLNYFFKVISRKTKETVAEIRAHAQKSRTVAQEKKRRRIFDLPIDKE